MAVVVRTTSLPEAQVIASGLRASGVRADVFGPSARCTGRRSWPSAASAWSRLPATCRTRGAFVRYARNSGPRPRPLAWTRGVAWRLLAAAFGLVVSPYAGFLIVGMRSGQRRGLGLAGSVAVTGIMAAAMAVIGYAVAWFLARASF